MHQVSVDILGESCLAMDDFEGMSVCAIKFRVVDAHINIVEDKCQLPTREITCRMYYFFIHILDCQEKGCYFTSAL